MFTPSNMLLSYLNAQPRDRFDIIGALIGYINADPKFETNDFEQAIQYVLNHGVSKEELFTQFDDEIEYEENSTKWNEEYYAYARVYLKDNFCEKRIKHVEAIAHKLYSTSKKKSDGEKNILSNAAKNSGVSSSKKCQGQQTPVVPNSVPIVAKVLSVIAVIVLLAFIIAGVMHQK